LFIRHAKGASPTQAGKTFYPSAVKVLNEINTMQGLFHDCPTLLPLRIALMPFLSGERIGLSARNGIRIRNEMGKNGQVMS